MPSGKLAARTGRLRQNREVKDVRPSPLPARSSTSLWICLALLCATFLIYWQVHEFSFVDYDDGQIVDDPHIGHGLTVDGLKWAFASTDGANWYPLTRLSHLLDSQLLGMNAGLHHLTNVLIHSLATLLLFAFLRHATGAVWRSAFVAFVFALHPLHVESVAWVAERKDVLCALFWFLTFWAYVWYVERPGLSRYILVFLSFGLGLMAKPMIVTLPLVLFLIDLWPLRRKRTAALIWEKVPLMALSAASAVVTFLAQKNGGAVELLTDRPIGLRIENALVSYCAYIGQMFWPAKLAVLYPYPELIPIWQAAIAGTLLGAVLTGVLRLVKGHPHLAVGWLW
jgi:hypothetical protein